MRRSLSIIVALAFALAPHSAAAGEVCEQDPTSCAAGNQIAGCRSVAVLVTAPRTVVAEASAVATGEPSEEAARADVVGRRMQTPLGGALIDVGAAHATCQAYTTGTGDKGRKACGRAAIDSVMVDLNALAGVVITARGIVEEGCTGIGPGASGAYNVAHIHQVLLHVQGGTGPIEIDADPDTSVGLGPQVRLYLNERTFPGAVCPANAGAAIRIEAEGESIVIGWVSTSACA